MKHRKIALCSILIVVLLLVSVFLLLYRPTALAGDTRYEPVLTGSMEPTLPVGSVVVIKPIEVENLVVGDIICYSFSETTLITHRIIEISNAGLVTKGDANEDADSTVVRRSLVIGKVAFMIPIMGHIASFLKTPLGFVLLLVLPSSLFIFFELKNIVSELKRKNAP